MPAILNSIKPSLGVFSAVSLHVNPTNLLKNLTDVSMKFSEGVFIFDRYPLKNAKGMICIKGFKF